MSVFKQPQCLISFDSNGILEVRQEVLRQIVDIERPLNIIAVVGLYRTGKSYLLNRLAEVKDGFEIGSSIQSQTKGIWIWCRPHPTKKDQVLVLMDTEGLGDVEKGNKNQDCWIFVLASLLCSTLVFNVKNVFDQDTLEKISFVTEMSKRISVSNQKEQHGCTDICLFFPVFVLVIRDFSLDLEAKGKRMSPDEYLDEVCLNVSSQKDSKYNEPRQCLRKCFVNRRCFTFGSPARTKLLKELNKVNDDKLDEDFLKEFQRFKKFVLEECSHKKLENGRMVNGPMLASLVQSYVTSIQSGKLPCIEDALNTMASIENKKAVEKCVETYTTKMTESVSFPTDTLQPLSDAHHESVKVAIDQFLKTAVYDKDQSFMRRAKELIEEKYKALVEENEKVSIQKSREALRNLSASLDQKTRAGEYARPGGYDLYKTGLNEVEAKYKQLHGLGIKKEVILFEYLKKKHEEASQIMDTESKMTQLEREAEDEDDILQEAEIIDFYQHYLTLAVAEMHIVNEIEEVIKEVEFARKIQSLQTELYTLKEEKSSSCLIM